MPRERAQTNQSSCRHAGSVLVLLLQLLVGAFVAGGAVAADRTATDAELVPVLGLESTGQPLFLGGYWSILDDPDGSLSLADVSSAEYQQQFVGSDANGLSRGYIDGVIWLRFQLANRNSEQRDWLLELDYPLLDDVQVSTRLLTPGGPGKWTTTHTGDRLPYADRPLPHRTFLIPLTLQQGQQAETIVRLATSSSMQVRPALHAADELFHRESRDNIIFGLVYGFMLLMALYNAFLYMAVRDPAYLAYVVAVLSGTLFIMSINGHAAQYLWPHNPQLANAMVLISASLWVLSTLVFTQLFLETRKYTRRGWQLINGLIVLGVLAVGVSLTASYGLAVQVNSMMGLLIGVLILGVSLLCWKRGNRSARFFTAAWLAYGAGTTFMILNRMGVLPNTFFTYHSATMGLMAEIVILSLAMSDKYRLMREQLATYSRGLEHKVAERTAELEALNEQLREMAQRDGLTRLANRRMFDSSLGSEWERHRRDRNPLALLLVDVDHFKQLNDHFGHQTGDRCLQAVASAMSASLQRPADIAARYGGDEFALILPETDSAGALEVAERISAAVRELAIPQGPAAASEIVTLSIGVVSRVPRVGSSMESLIEEADAALYMAKDRGRAQVMVAPPDLMLRAAGG